MSLSIEGKVESIWIELSYTKYIVAGIYRHPNHNIADFSVQLENVLEKLSKSKIHGCVIAGDLNSLLTLQNMGFTRRLLIMSITF